MLALQSKGPLSRENGQSMAAI
ncbi:hypothetical protein BOSE21B_50115 [Bosea sp. 21B]|nr:hypothetical protein BOSE21B_50115 [Bosea sp. 21B]